MWVETSEVQGQIPQDRADMNQDGLELTILMPCLNEAGTLDKCIRKAQSSLKELNVSGEVLIADNGSTDGSQEIAAKWVQGHFGFHKRLRQCFVRRDCRSPRKIHHHGRRGRQLRFCKSRTLSREAARRS